MKLNFTIFRCSWYNPYTSSLPASIKGYLDITKPCCSQPSFLSPYCFISSSSQCGGPFWKENEDICYRRLSDTYEIQL